MDRQINGNKIENIHREDRNDGLKVRWLKEYGPPMGVAREGGVTLLE